MFLVFSCPHSIVFLYNQVSSSTQFSPFDYQFLQLALLRAGFWGEIVERERMPLSCGVMT